MVAHLTGPYSTIVPGIWRGVLDYCQNLNEQGGIDGIKVEVFWADMKGQAAMAVSSYERFKHQGIVGMIPYTSTDSIAIISRLNNDKIPAVSSGASKVLYVPPSYFFAVVSTAQMMPLISGWYHDEWQKKGLDRPMRLATLGWDNAYGREGLEPVARWAEGQGIEFVGALWVSPTAMDYTTQLSVLKGREPDAITAILNGGFMCRDANRVGLSEETPLLIEAGSIAAKGYIGLAGPEITRAYTTHYMFWTPGEQDPSLQRWLEIYRRYHGEEVREVLDYLSGVEIAGLLCEGTRRAIDKVGYENLNGEAVKEGLEKVSRTGILVLLLLQLAMATIPVTALLWRCTE